jgi:hypothetical protein
MTKEEFKLLDRGDIVRHKGSSGSLIVLSNDGNSVIAIRESHLTNPDEWDLLFKAKLIPHQQTKDAKG